MLSIFKKIEYIWENYGFEFLVVLSFIFILLYGFYNCLKGRNGSWSNKQYYDYNIRNPHENLNSLKSQSQFQSQRNFGESKGEIECRRVLEHFFKRPFNKSRPDFLRNEVTGNINNLELDCFNQELKLAVEYNGIQHYKFTPYFHKSHEHFLTQKYRDYMKRNLCRDAGITLIEVPYTVQNNKIYDYLRLQLINNGFHV